MAEIFFRSRRLAGTEAMVPPAKPTTTILPSHARLRGKRRNVKRDAHSHPLGWQLLKKKKRSVGKDVEKREPLSIIAGIVKWYNRYGQRYGGASKN